jgi:hypothetical protein
VKFLKKNTFLEVYNFELALNVLLYFVKMNVVSLYKTLLLKQREAKGDFHFFSTIHRIMGRIK